MLTGMASPRRIVGLSVGAAAVVARVVFPVMPALAASGTAIVTSIRQDTVSPQNVVVPVSGTGCVTPNGSTNTVQLRLRGPGAATNVVSLTTTPASPTGAFDGMVFIPFVGAVPGSTYKVSAQCIEQGQPPGTESVGIPLMVAFPSPTPPGQAVTIVEGPAFGGNAPGQAGSTQTSGGATTGRATPIAAQPKFTG